MILAKIDGRVMAVEDGLATSVFKLYIVHRKRYFGLPVTSSPAGFFESPTETLRERLGTRLLSVRVRS